MKKQITNVPHQTSHLDQHKRLKRIHGQVQGVMTMIEDKRYCMDILIQLKAIRSALRAVENDITEQHINHCVKRAILSKNKEESENTLAEIKLLLQQIK